MYGSYLNFILYLALEEVLALEERRNISLDQINEYRKEISKGMKAFYQDCKFYDSNYENQAMLFISTNEDMTDKEFYEEIKDIVNEDDSLYISDNKVCIVRDLLLKELNNKKFLTDNYQDKSCINVCYDILQNHNYPEMLEKVGIESSIRQIESLIKFEKALHNMCLSPEYDDNIAKNYIQLLLKAKKYKLSQKGVFEFSKYWNLYDKVSQKMVKDCVRVVHDEKLGPYYMKHLEAGYDFEGSYIEAIFGDENEIYAKLEDFFEMTSLYKSDAYYDEDVDEDELDDSFDYDYVDSDNVEPYDDEYIDEYDEDEAQESISMYDTRKNELYAKNIFYLRYIDIIDQYQEKYGTIDNLDIIKRKLLYILNDYDEGLLSTVGLKFKMSEAYKLKLEKEYLRNFHVMARIFIEDILNNKMDNKTLKKVLFIDNYYRISQNDTIRKILEDNRNTSMGIKLYQAVINHDYDISLKKSLVGKSKRPMQ